MIFPMKVQIALLAGAVVVGGTVAVAELNKAPANNSTPSSVTNRMASNSPQSSSPAPVMPQETNSSAPAPSSNLIMKPANPVLRPQQPNQINGGGDDGFRGGDHEGEHGGDHEAGDRD
jgi:hypothetical protein